VQKIILNVYLGGISLLLIERGMPGVSTRHMQCSGMWASGTAYHISFYLLLRNCRIEYSRYVTFEDVKVPVENLIGEENKGFKCIMFNFNHERWGIVVQVGAS
jgi:alkylation response protein AidB-like acyl-CoA dehydrogenase